MGNAQIEPEFRSMVLPLVEIEAPDRRPSAALSPPTLEALYCLSLVLPRLSHKCYPDLVLPRPRLLAATHQGGRALLLCLPRVYNSLSSAGGTIRTVSQEGRDRKRMPVHPKDSSELYTSCPLTIQSEARQKLSEGGLS